jgi:hypothetical protein
VLGCKDSRQRHYDKFDVINRHAGPLCLLLGILHHDKELGDAICLHLALHHIHEKQDHVKGMQPFAVGVKEGHDVDGCDLHLEGVSIVEVIVPNLVIIIAENLGHALFSRLVTGIVIELGFVGGLRMNVNHCRGIISNRLVVEWETSRADKFGTMVVFVLDSLGEDSREGVNPV